MNGAPEVVLTSHEFPFIIITYKAKSKWAKKFATLYALVHIATLHACCNRMCSIIHGVLKITAEVQLEKASSFYYTQYKAP